MVPPAPQKNIVLADCDNHRVQVFDRNGNFVSRFGELGSLDNQLSDPEGLSINGKDNINVADRDNKLIKTFSSSGKYLRKFGGASSLVNPYHCIQHGQYFIVSEEINFVRLFCLDILICRNWFCSWLCSTCKYILSI